MVQVVELASTADGAQLERWSLALLALGVPHQIMPGVEVPTKVLLVRAQDVEKARGIIHEVDQEQAQRVEEASKATLPAKTPRWAILWAEVLAAIITLISVVAGPRGAGSTWMQRGRLDSDLVFAGQVHRVFTAVTLHADLPHLLSNLAFLLVVAPTVIHRLGPGIAFFTVVWSGAIGNLVTIGFHGQGFGNVGASGGIFGLACVLGILAARARVSRIGANRWILGTGAALGLLAMLAFGDNADVVAHLAGFFSAAPIGLWAPMHQEERDGPAVPRWWWPWQLTTMALAVGVVTWAWMTALGRTWW